ncbi:MAG: hypothetical protein AB7T31_08775 [Gemmatimonadales bacterium]
MRFAHGSRLAAALGALACAPIAAAGPGCAPVGSPALLPDELQETSGIAVSGRDPGIFWTHNDDGAVIFAIDRAGRVLGRHRLSVEPNDLEDVESAPCSDGSPCLYFADTGDNAERREAVRILRVREPAGRDGGDALPADVFPFRYPEGPRDTEAVFVLPGERVYLVTKGRSHAITLYRYPGTLRPDTVVVEEIQRLTGGAEPLLDQVTGASASPSGSTVAIRTYQALRFYGVSGDSLVAVRGGVVNLRTLREIQGEGLSLSRDGRVLLTSEGGPLGGPASLTELRCLAEVGTAR